MTEEEIEVFLNPFTVHGGDYLIPRELLDEKFDDFITREQDLIKYLEEELGDRRNPRKDMWLMGVHDAYQEILDKIKGSNNDSK